MKKVKYMCPKCFRMYDRYSKNENKCSCHKRLVSIDSGISEVIQLLNKKFYKTRFCCEGHWYRNGEFNIPYVVIEPLTFREYSNIVWSNDVNKVHLYSRRHYKKYIEEMYAGIAYIFKSLPTLFDIEFVHPYDTDYILDELSAVRRDMRIYLSVNEYERIVDKKSFNEVKEEALDWLLNWAEELPPATHSKYPLNSVLFDELNLDATIVESNGHGDYSFKY